MPILFVSRANVHARYYKKLSNALGLDSRVHIMGKPSLAALGRLAEAFAVDLSPAIETQLKRKCAKQSWIWRFAPVCSAYRVMMSIFEHCRLAKYLALLDQLKPSKVVLWNGKKLPNRTVVLAARQLGVPVFYFENGLLPNTTCLDPHGVNQDASLPKDPAFFKALAFAEQSECCAITPREPHRRRKQGEAKCLPERFVFVPFQVPHDTQIVCHSPWVQSMEQLFDAVVDAVNALGDPSLKIVFKEHPTWPKNFPHLYDKSDNALFCNDNDIRDLMNKAEAVITVNSTVGLEALQLGKKVITLGESCYNLEGLVQHAGDHQALVAALRRLPEWQLDCQLAENYFTYLKTIYCIPGNWKQCDEHHVQAVTARLLAKDQFSQLSLPRQTG